MATATVTGEVLGTRNAKIWENPGKDGGPKLFTPWLVKDPERLAPVE